MLSATTALELLAGSVHTAESWCTELVQAYGVTISLTGHYRTETHVTGNTVDVGGLQIRA